MNWRLIETAPKDAIFVLVWNGKVHKAAFAPTYSDGGAQQEPSWTVGTGWLQQLDPQPTHWMPLPEAPK